MKSANNVSLRDCNSFAVDVTAPIVYYPKSIVDLDSLSTMLPNKYYILGEGYNTLFVDETAPIIIKPEFTGVDISEDVHNFYVKAGASENWHELVLLLVSKGINGLENLALIPGSVGAAPIQNIGAYGVEFATYCHCITWYDFELKTQVSFDKQQCEFGYRESIFKRKISNGLITHVELVIPKNWQPQLAYNGLKNLGSKATASQILKTVIDIRQSKLPDPHHLPNAGSFFKNPVVEKQFADKLRSQYPTMPYYPQKNHDVKLAAGWLIEKAGLKGYLHGKVGVHDKQALVIVNHGSKAGKDITVLAKHIQKTIEEKFAITLEPEVRWVFADTNNTIKDN